MKILAIGNSFSVDALEYFEEVAKDLGEEVIIGDLFIGSCTIDTHANNAQGGFNAYEFYTNFAIDGLEPVKTPTQSMESMHVGKKWNAYTDYALTDAISLTDWDVVTVQQGSGYSGRPNSYKRLPELLAFVRKNTKPETKIYFHNTWAYQQDSTHPHFAFYDNSQKKMYKCILSALETEVKTNPEINGIIPSGIAVQNARKEFGDTMTRDGFHMSFSLGRYLTSLVWAKTLFGKAEGVSFAPDGVTEKDKALCQKVLQKTFAK